VLTATVDPNGFGAAERFDRAEALEASVGAPFLLARTRDRRAGRRRLDRT
jgi:hypothetical protein